MILGGSTTRANRELKFLFGEKNRDISRLTRRLFDAFAAQARPELQAQRNSMIYMSRPSETVH
jgi:hypothetical protein